MCNQIHLEEFVSLGTKLLNRLAIIAGKGKLPKIIYSESKRQGRDPILITFEGLNKNIELNDIETFKVHFGKVGKILNIIKNNNCQDVILVGAFSRPSFKSLAGIDIKGVSLISKIVKSTGDNKSLEIIINYLIDEGLNVLGTKDIVPHLFIEKKILTNTKPDKNQKEGIKIGEELLKIISEYDIGQSIVISSKRILGIEGPEGTDELIKRCGKMSFEQKPILIKRCKIYQDIRVDLPTIGLDTLKFLYSSGFSGVAFQSSLTIVIEKEELIEFANMNKLFVESI